MGWAEYRITGHLLKNTPLKNNHKLAMIDALIERASVTSVILNESDISTYKAQNTMSRAFRDWIYVSLNLIVKKYIKDISFGHYYLGLGDFPTPAKGWFSNNVYADFFNCFCDIINRLIYIGTQVNPVKSYLHNTSIDQNNSKYLTEYLKVIRSGYPSSNNYSKNDYPASKVFDSYFDEKFSSVSEITTSSYNIIRLYTNGVFSEEYNVWAALSYYLFFKVTKFGYTFVPKNSDLNYVVYLKATYDTSIFYNQTIQFLYKNGAVIQPEIIKTKMQQKIQESIKLADLHTRYGDLFLQYGYDYQRNKMYSYSGSSPFGFKNYYIGKDYNIYIKPEFAFHE